MKKHKAKTSGNLAAISAAAGFFMGLLVADSISSKFGLYYAAEHFREMDKKKKKGGHK